MMKLQRGKIFGASAMLAASLSVAGMTARPAAQTTGTMAPAKPMPTMGMSPMSPMEGHKAPDFALTSIDGATVRLSAEVAHGPIVLVVLRGWPGYQCPFCTRQFGDYLTHAGEIESTGAKVLFVYPGPADGLKDHAVDFTKSTPLPAGFRVLLDPDYTFTNAYGLRWNAPQETAYPSTYVLGKDGVIVLARTSHEHGGRVPVTDVLTALGGIKR
jgi:thioredoxin-dependent peroxiredoxin